MGEVVSMANWKPKPPVKSQPLTEEIQRRILGFLRQSLTRSNQVHTLGSVQEREQAVIDGMKLMEKAHKEAAAVGWTLRKEENGQFSLKPKEMV